MAETMTPQQELVVLRKYAQGMELLDITKELGCVHEDTVGVVSAVGFQRGRAGELLRQREAALVASRRQAAPVSSPPAPKPPAAEAPAGPVNVEDVLARAVEAGGRYAARAERIRGQVQSLAVELDEHQAVIAAEREVAELAARLEEARAKVRELKATPTKAAIRAEVSESQGVVRDWAKANGYECAPSGRIPTRILEAYRAAQGEAA